MKSRLSSAELTKIVIENVTDWVKPFVYKYQLHSSRAGRLIDLEIRGPLKFSDSVFFQPSPDPPRLNVRIEKLALKDVFPEIGQSNLVLI